MVDSINGFKKTAKLTLICQISQFVDFIEIFIKISYKLISNIQIESFTINERKEWIRNFDEILSNIESKTETLLDSRSIEKFFGHEDHTGVKKGHIKGAINLPFSYLFDSKNGTLKDTEILEKSKSINIHHKYSNIYSSITQFLSSSS